MKRRRLWLMFFFIPIFVFALLFHFRERPLLERATILESDRSNYQDFDSLYLWLSDSRILFIDSTPKGYKARVRDIETGQVMPYHGKGTFFGNRSIDDTIFRLSTDKKRLLWVSNGEVIATDSEGREHGKWDRQLGQGMYVKEWMPESLHWVEAIEKSNGTYAKIHGVGEADKPEQKIQGLGDGKFLGFTSRKTLLTVDIEKALNKQGQYVILETALDKTMPIPISLPLKVYPNAMSLSPQGSKLAWITTEQQKDAFQRLSERLGFGAGRYKTIYALWTSNSNGSQTKNRGIITAIPDTVPNEEMNSPSALAWLPNGKQVSFYLGDKLYAVDME